MKKILPFFLLVFSLNFAQAETTSPQSCIQKISYHGECARPRISSAILSNSNPQSADVNLQEKRVDPANMTYRAATVLCLNGRMKMVHVESCASKTDLAAKAETACNEMQACTPRDVKKPSLPPVVKSPVAEPPHTPPVIPVNNPPKIPSAPVMRPIETNQSPVSSGGGSPSIPPTGSSDATKTPDSGVPSVTTTNNEPSSGGASTDKPAGYSGSFYSVRTGLKINNNIAEVVYSDSSASAGMICSANRYVLHLDMSNASNAAFVNNTPPAATYQTVNLSCPFAPSPSSLPYNGGTIARTNNIAYPEGCVVVSSLNGSAYKAPRCAIP